MNHLSYSSDISYDQGNMFIHVPTGHAYSILFSLSTHYIYQGMYEHDIFGTFPVFYRRKEKIHNTTTYQPIVDRHVSEDEINDFIVTLMVLLEEGFDIPKDMIAGYLAKEYIIAIDADAPRESLREQVVAINPLTEEIIYPCRDNETNI